MSVEQSKASRKVISINRVETSRLTLSVAKKGSSIYVIVDEPKLRNPTENKKQDSKRFEQIIVKLNNEINQ